MRAHSGDFETLKLFYRQDISYPTSIKAKRCLRVHFSAKPEDVKTKDAIAPVKLEFDCDDDLSKGLFGLVQNACFLLSAP